eukprot:3859721-Pyramimonas_sp.AAC.1
MAAEAQCQVTEDSVDADGDGCRWWKNKLQQQLEDHYLDRGKQTTELSSGLCYTAYNIPLVGSSIGHILQYFAADGIIRDSLQRGFQREMEIF